jgi:hypothetical protein
LESGRIRDLGRALFQASTRNRLELPFFLYRESFGRLRLEIALTQFSKTRIVSDFSTDIPYANALWNECQSVSSSDQTQEQVTGQENITHSKEDRKKDP